MTAMQTAPTKSFLPQGRPLTRADLDAAPDDGHRYELIDGTLVVTPAPRPLHQIILVNLLAELRATVPEDLRVLCAPLDVVLSEDTIIQPDLLVAPREAFTDRDLPTAPLLAVEILSPSTRGIDLLLKRDRLQRAGCPHYWVVDPDAPSIHAWTLVNGTYIETPTAMATENDVFAVNEPFPINFPLSDLLA